MRWGYFHSLNNYVNKFSMAYTVHSGCDIYAENCVYENGGNVICDWNTITYAGAYAESGSKFSNCQRTVQGQGTQSNPAYSKPSYWRPNKNYSYKSISADSAKSYCSSYSGCQSTASKVNYLRLSAAGVPSAGFVTVPSGPMKPKAASFNEGSTFTIKNAEYNSYLSLGIGTGSTVHIVLSREEDLYTAVWKLFSAGDGYYYIALASSDNEVIEAPGGTESNSNGFSLSKYSGSDKQQFKFLENSDGTYTIVTKASEEASAMDAAMGNMVCQSELADDNKQHWQLVADSDPGCIMDTNVIYTFKNVNSGLVMDIVYGKMEDGTNVQQWEQNGYDCQKWVLKRDGATGSPNVRYFIRSLQDENYALRVEDSGNGANISIAPFSENDDNQAFIFSKNLDGTYSILSYVSGGTRYVEVDAAKKDGGANVQHWENTNNSCQKWELLTEAKPVVEGDVNNDGELNIADAVKLQNYLLGRKSASDINLIYADLDGNGAINVFDLILLKRMIFAA
jgi:pectin lyase